MILKAINFESDVEDHVNSWELSELSDAFDDELSDDADEAELSLSINDISFSRDLSLVNIPQRKESRKRLESRKSSDGEKGSQRVFREVQSILKSGKDSKLETKRESKGNEIGDVGDLGRENRSERRGKADKDKCDRREREKDREDRREDRRERGKHKKDKEKQNIGEFATTSVPTEYHGFHNVVKNESIPRRFEKYSGEGQASHRKMGHISSHQDQVGGYHGAYALDEYSHGFNHNALAQKLDDQSQSFYPTQHVQYSQSQPRGAFFAEQRQRKYSARSQDYGHGDPMYEGDTIVDRNSHYYNGHNYDFQSLTGYDYSEQQYGSFPDTQNQQYSSYRGRSGGAPRNRSGPSYTNPAAPPSVPPPITPEVPPQQVGAAHLNPNAREFVPSNLFR